MTELQIHPLYPKPIETVMDIADALKRQPHVPLLSKDIQDLIRDSWATHNRKPQRGFSYAGLSYTFLKMCQSNELKDELVAHKAEIDTQKAVKASTSLMRSNLKVLDNLMLKLQSNRNAIKLTIELIKNEFDTLNKLVDAES